MADETGPWRDVRELPYALAKTIGERSEVEDGVARGAE